MRRITAFWLPLLPPKLNRKDAVHYHQTSVIMQKAGFL
jgi:hypothetical protein